MAFTLGEMTLPVGQMMLASPNDVDLRSNDVGFAKRCCPLGKLWLISQAKSSVEFDYKAGILRTVEDALSEAKKYSWGAPVSTIYLLFLHKKQAVATYFATA